MKFIVENEVFDRFPGLRIAVAVVEGIANDNPRPKVSEDWQATWQETSQLSEQYSNAQSHPNVDAWRERFKAMGISPRDYPSSVEAMLRRALKGGEPLQVNPLVDFIHAISLRNVVPVGGYDLGELNDDVRLRLTEEGDEFRPMGSHLAEPVPAGEVAFASGQTVLTRHFVWRQSEDAMIHSGTTEVLLVSEIPGELDQNLPGQVAAEFESGLAAEFGVDPLVSIVDADHPQLKWENAKL